MRTQGGQVGKDFHTLKDVWLHAGGQRRNVRYGQVRVLLTSPGKWNHLQAPLQAHRANRWSSDIRGEPDGRGGRGSPGDQPRVSPAPGQEKVRGSRASAWAGNSPTCPSMPLQSKLGAAARCERKLCPLGTSHWRIPKRLGNGEKGALSGRLVKELHPARARPESMTTSFFWNILQRHLLTKV